MEQNIEAKLLHHVYWPGFLSKLSWNKKNYYFDINDYNDLLMVIKKISKEQISLEIYFLLFKLTTTILSLAYEKDLYSIPLNITKEELYDYCFNLRDAIENVLHK